MLMVSTKSLITIYIALVCGYGKKRRKNLIQISTIFYPCLTIRVKFTVVLVCACLCGYFYQLYQPPSFAILPFYHFVV